MENTKENNDNKAMENWNEKLQWKITIEHYSCKAKEKICFVEKLVLQMKFFCMEWEQKD